MTRNPGKENGTSGSESARSRDHQMSITEPMEVIVYSSPWCRDCHVAKRWLAQHNIAFKEINIEEVPGAAEDVILNTGKRAVPQFVINGRWVQPYTPGQG